MTAGDTPTNGECSAEELPDEAWLAALLALSGMGPKRLTALLEIGSPKDVWETLQTSRPVCLEDVRHDQVTTWRSEARAASVEDLWRRSLDLGQWTYAKGHREYPNRLRDDIEPPDLLFGLGARIGRQPTVGIVGTRNCTSYGKRCAFEFGAALASAGVSVVSGLALGIDTAAHQGVLSVKAETAAPPIGVVGSGLDVVYPKRNTKLWADVATHGTLLSETAPGQSPTKWRFPARNRIIAALSDAVIVIESHDKGGSLSTVDSAQARDIPVGAVPGPITSNSSAGTNQLLADGATPVLSVDDILCMIGHVAPQQLVLEHGEDETASGVLDALGWNPQLFEELCNRVALEPSVLAAEVERLVGAGLLVRTGPWIERTR